MKNRTYIAIDLKSFYASVECRERGLDPLDTNLVVADESRTDKTICLAVTPSLKSYGISGRGRLFEVKQRVKEANAGRQHDAPGHKLEGSSCFFLDPRQCPLGLCENADKLSALVFGRDLELVFGVPTPSFSAVLRPVCGFYRRGGILTLPPGGNRHTGATAFFLSNNNATMQGTPNGIFQGCSRLPCRKNCLQCCNLHSRICHVHPFPVLAVTMSGMFFLASLTVLSEIPFSFAAEKMVLHGSISPPESISRISSSAAAVLVSALNPHSNSSAEISP